MDYVDFIVHVFSPEKRAFYGLERLRKSATTLSIAELNAEIKAAVAAKRPQASAKALMPKKNTPVAASKRAPVKKAAPAKKSTAKKLTLPKKTAAKKASPTKAAGRKTK
jgi:ribosome-associated protein